MSATWRGLTVMTWASYALSNNYAEIDLFLSYNIGGLTLNLNDYFSENELNMASTSYTEWRDTLTSHLIETSVVYQLPIEMLPISFTASIFLYGADLNESSEQNYSMYFEANLPFKAGNNDCSVFIGGSPYKGYYASDAALVNLGMSAMRDIQINNDFSIPLSTSLVFHPYNKDVFFTVGITF